MAPGPELAALLAGLDRSRLNGHEMVIVLQARARIVAHCQAEMYADMLEVALSPAGDASSRPERVNNLDEDSRRRDRSRPPPHPESGRRRIGNRLEPGGTAPRGGGSALRRMIDLPRARVICDGTAHLTEDQAREAARVVLAEAPGLTTGQLGARLRRLTISIDPADARHRYQSGLSERRVIGESNPDGTANLLALNLPPESVAAMLQRVNRLAREAKTPGDERSIDQVRADVFGDLVTGRGRAPPPPGRWTSMSTWPPSPGSQRFPGRSRGGERSSPTSPARWHWPTRVANGGSPSPTPNRREVLWNGTTRRRPSAGERRYVLARQPVCVFPGCRMPARDSDLDHTVEYSKGGRTHPHNLGPLCRYHHRLRHEAGWKLEQPTPGTFVWTSPLGHTYYSGPRGP